METPLPCVSGVTGANLRKGIEGVLPAGAIAALGLPIVAGIMSVAAIRAQSPSPQSAPGTFPKFEVVSIKPCKPGVSKGRGPDGPRVSGAGSSPGRLRIGCGILADSDNAGMIQVAYNRHAGGY